MFFLTEWRCYINAFLAFSRDVERNETPSSWCYWELLTEIVSSFWQEEKRKFIIAKWNLIKNFLFYYNIYNEPNEQTGSECWTENKLIIFGRNEIRALKPSIFKDEGSNRG